MVLFEKPDTLGPEHVDMVYVDPDTLEVYGVMQRFHCAGGVDEHQYVCRLNHWNSYELEKIEGSP